MVQVAAGACNCSALRQAARHATRMYDDALAPTGLGLNQFSILARIDRCGPTDLGDLARRLVMDRSTLGHLLRPLQARGLLTLQASACDKRRRLIALTGEGAALLRQAQPHWLRAQNRFEDAFGQPDASHLRSILARLVATPFADTATRHEEVR